MALMDWMKRVKRANQKKDNLFMKHFSGHPFFTSFKPKHFSLTLKVAHPAKPRFLADVSFIVTGENFTTQAAGNFLKVQGGVQDMSKSQRGQLRRDTQRC